jgi:hypothetical protein
VDGHGITSEPRLFAPVWRGRDSAIERVIGTRTFGTSAKIIAIRRDCLACQRFQLERLFLTELER